MAVSITQLQLSRESYFEFPDSTTIDVKLLHWENTEILMLVTQLGIEILVKPLHQQNADAPILVTLLGIVIFVKPLQ